jgi:hypothetical protein
MNRIAMSRMAALWTMVAALSLSACTDPVEVDDAAAYWSAYYAAAADDRAKNDADAKHAIDPLKWVAAAEKAIGIDESAKKRTAWLDWTRKNRRVEYQKRADAAEQYVTTRLAAVKKLAGNVDTCLRIAQTDTGPVAIAALDAAIKAGVTDAHATAISEARKHIEKVTAIERVDEPSPSASPDGSGS